MLLGSKNFSTDVHIVSGYGYTEYEIWFCESCEKVFGKQTKNLNHEPSECDFMNKADLINGARNQITLAKCNLADRRDAAAIENLRAATFAALTGTPETKEK